MSATWAENSTKSSCLFVIAMRSIYSSCIACDFQIQCKVMLAGIYSFVYTYNDVFSVNLKK